MILFKKRLTFETKDTILVAHKLIKLTTVAFILWKVNV